MKVAYIVVLFFLRSCQIHNYEATKFSMNMVYKKTNSHIEQTTVWNCISFKEYLIEPIESYHNNERYALTKGGIGIDSVKNWIDTLGFYVFNTKKKELEVWKYDSTKRLIFEYTTKNYDQKSGIKLSFTDKFNFLEVNKLRDTNFSGFSFKILDTSYYEIGKGKLKVKYFFTNEINTGTKLTDTINKGYDIGGLNMISDSLGLEQTYKVGKKRHIDQKEMKILKLLTSRK
jgi:hypothetical protein